MFQERYCFLRYFFCFAAVNTRLYVLKLSLTKYSLSLFGIEQKSSKSKSCTSSRYFQLLSTIGFPKWSPVEPLNINWLFIESPLNQWNRERKEKKLKRRWCNSDKIRTTNYCIIPFPLSSELFAPRKDGPVCLFYYCFSERPHGSLLWTKTAKFIRIIYSAILKFIFIGHDVLNFENNWFQEVILIIH